MKSRWFAYVLFGSVSLSLACKGSSGPSYIKVDVTVPPDGETAVIVDTDIAIRMNARIDPSTLTTDTFFLTDADGAVVPSTVGIIDEPDADTNQQGTAAQLEPDESLEVETVYTVTVTTELTSTGGESLQEDYQFTFTTLDAAWGEAEWLEQLGDWSSSEQQVAVDEELAAIAVWKLDDGVGDPTNTSIWANRYTRKGLWGEPEPIDDGNGRAAKPMLAMDGPGNAFVVWERSDSDVLSVDRKIWTNRYDVEEGSWDTPALLQNGVETRAQFPSIAASSSGVATAVWVQRIEETDQEIIRAIRYEPGTGWGVAVTIGAPQTRTAAEATAVGMDDAGAAIAVWNPPSGAVQGARVLVANRYDPEQGGWGDETPIKRDAATSANGVRLDVGANGKAVVTWIQDNGPRNDIYAVRFSGETWGEPTRIDAQDEGNKTNPDVAVDGAGNAYVVWSQIDARLDRPDAPLENIWVAEYRAEASKWGEPVLIEPPTEDPNEDADAITPRIDTNRAGNVFVVWSQRWEGRPSIWSNRIDPGESWMDANAKLIENFASTARLPEIAVDEERHAHSVWQHQNSGLPKIRTNRFE